MEKQYQVAAYYFPNYHEDDWNLEWHGEGWNEWELLKAAGPRFEGHMQPKVPLWGYENEADPKVMEKKIKAAADHGLSAFLFDWYWYEEGPYLHRCLEDGFLKADNNSDLKFALMWANHDWLEIQPATRCQPYPKRTIGAVSEEVFIKATDHMIAHYFGHPSYWKIEGKLYFSIYEMMSLVKGLGGLEQTKRVLEELRQRVRAKGLGELHLNAVVWGINTLPTENAMTDPNEVVEYLGIDSVTSYVWIHHLPMKHFPTESYPDAIKKCKCEHVRLTNEHTLPYIPNVTMGWDSSPRTVQTDRFDPVGYPYSPVYIDNTPEQFAKALQDVKDFIDSGASKYPICTINAWNEWTEGSYLEPDTIHGMGYLEAIRDVFGKQKINNVLTGGIL